MSFLKLENKSLQKRLAEQQRYRAKMGELVSDLSEARKQMVRKRAFVLLPSVSV